MTRRLLVLGVLAALAASPCLAESDEVAVAAVLDALHDAASKADGDRYFGLFAEGAIFFGTDATERWTIAEFHGFADPFFEQGKGWTYRVEERNVFFGPAGTVAWFDEELSNDTYGPCRGTGVLVATADGWKISQYNLTIPIPNDLALTVVEMIRAAE